MVFKDKSDLSLFTRQGGEDRMGAFVVIRKKNRPEKKKRKIR